MKPIVAIIGRPNVGKSTLFNRLVKERKAIVLNEPGITRDRNYAEAEWEGREFTVIDTGGFEPAAENDIFARMKEQTLLAIEEADAVIFLMDGRAGIAPADYDIAAQLRQIDKPVFFAVNKIDTPTLESYTAEFFALGVDRLYPLSASHGEGIFELMDDVLASLPPSAPSLTPPEEEFLIRIAIIGRPNVGKSSLVNRILGYDRTIVDPTPGTTRDAVDAPLTYMGRKYLLIDTAGIRRKSRISLTQEKYSVVSALRSIDRCDVALLVIDANEGITDQDVKIAGLAYEEGKACIIVVNKWDAIPKDNHTVGQYVTAIRERAKFLDFAPIIFVSALSGQRVSKILPVIEGTYEEYTRRITTAEVNRVCREIVAHYPPPRVRNRPNTVTYMTQTGIKPPTFVFFVRDPKAIHFSYVRFLENRIREVFEFHHVPIRLLFRKRHPARDVTERDA